MIEAAMQGTSVLTAVCNAVVGLHKDQYGRGPTHARSHFAGPDALLCVLDNVLLPAELKLIELGGETRVRDARTSLQAATASDFVAAIEEITGRTVRGFASGIDCDKNVVFESFAFEPRSEGAPA